MTKQKLKDKYGKVVVYIDRMFTNLNKITDKQIEDISSYYCKSSNEVRGIIQELEKNSYKKPYTTV